MLDFIRTSGVGVVVRNLLKPPADLLQRVDVATQEVRRYNNRAVFEVVDLLLERMAALPGVLQASDLPHGVPPPAVGAVGITPARVPAIKGNVA